MISRIYDPRLFARIEFILKRQIDTATREYHEARVEFWLITGTSAVADERHVADSGRKVAATRGALELANQRLNDFILKGTVPEDLTPREHPTEGAGESWFA